MDPLSITATTATLINITSSTCLKLYNFIQDTKNVDQSVKDLGVEVDALERTLVQVDSVLKEPRITTTEKRITTDESKQLWSTLNGCLEECQVTVVRLDSALDGVQKKSSNWAKQAFRQVKLNLKKDEINSLRIQIHTHYMTLSTALQMLNIRAAYLGPGLVVADLGPRIETLQKSLYSMFTSLNNLKADASRAPRDRAQIKPMNLERLYSLGNRILTKATTVYGSSVGDGSVYGDQATSKAVLRTMQWIPEPSTHDRAPSMSSTTLSSGHQSSSTAVDGGIDLVISQSDTLPSEADIIESDTEAEFEFELAQRLLDKGKEAFGSSNYQGAVGFLQKGVATFNKLPHKLRSKLDLVEIPLMIATCKYHLDEIDDASNDLMALIQQESSSDQDAIRKCQISYLLSQICLIRNDVEAAENHCRNSLKGRRRLLGKSHPDYFASLALLSEICLDNGKCEEAAVYKDMVPPELQQTAEMGRLKSLMKSQKAAHVTSESTSKSPASTAVSSLASLSSTRTAQISSELNVRKLVGHTEAVKSLAFSTDSTLLASASADKTVRLWDTRYGREIRQFKVHTTDAQSVAFSSDGSLLAAATWEKATWLWNPNTGQEIRRLSGHTNSVVAVAFSPTESLLATASWDRTVRLWNPKTGKELQKFEGHTENVETVAFSPDGLLLASGSWDKTVRVWDLKTRQEVQQFVGHTNQVKTLAFSPDGSLLASGSYDSTVRIWDLKTGLELQKLQGHNSLVLAIAFSSSSILASASWDQTVRLWNPRTGQELMKLEGHTNHVEAVAFPRNDFLLASGSADCTILLRRPQ